MKTGFFKSVSTLCIVVGAGAWPELALGQVALEAAESDDTGIADIVVTARRRSENLQDVPIAISAIGSDEIAKTGIMTVLDVAARSPNVTMTQFNIGEPQTYIRGVGSQTDSAASEPSVTVSLDEVPIGRGGAPATAFLDVSRVEVLRGPQGTLYGRNASAGAIGIYTNRPTGSFESSLEASYGSFQTYAAKGVLNVPLGNGLDMRAAGQYWNSDGYARNVATGEDLQGGERYAGRLALQAETSGWVINLSGDYSKDQMDGDSRYVLGSRAAVPPLLAAANALQSAYRGNVWKSSGFPGTFQRRRNYGIVGRLEKDADWGTITSLSAFRNNRYSLRQDYAGLPLAFPFTVDDRVPELPPVMTATRPSSRSGAVTTARRHRLRYPRR